MISEEHKIVTHFLTNMSHEIRTPMNSILGFIELVLDDSTLATEQRKNLDLAHRSAKHLFKIINDILYLSQIESGAVNIEKSNIFTISGMISTIESVSGVGRKFYKLRINEE